MDPKGATWRRERAKSDLSTADAATQLGITRQTLLNIETNQPRASVSMRLAYRAARLYEVAVDELVASGEGVPEEPPSKEQQPERNTGPGRKEDTKKPPKRSGPPRVDQGSAA